MQVHELDERPKHLQQGSIFEIFGLTLFHEGKALSLRDFYPHLSLEGVRYGIVVSQSCDLVRDDVAEGAERDRSPKVPYISIGFLEPFPRYVQRSGVDWNKARLAWMGPDDEGEGDETEYTFISSQRLRTVLSRSMRDLLQNNEKCYFFVSFPGNSPSERYFVLNLTKIVPIRVAHYSAILERVTHQLTTEFENKLGWKLAELYGRVGTKDYKTSELDFLIEELQDVIGPVIMSELTRAIKVEDEKLFEKAQALAKKTKNNASARAELFLEVIRSRKYAGSTSAAADGESNQGELLGCAPINFSAESLGSTDTVAALTPPLPEPVCSSIDSPDDAPV